MRTLLSLTSIHSWSLHSEIDTQRPCTLWCCTQTSNMTSFGQNVVTMLLCVLVHDDCYSYTETYNTETYNTKNGFAFVV